MFSIPQSTSFVAVFKAYLSSDHVTEATGKTIAITISKAGGAFGNPNAGATNATEISSGWYKVTLDATDTGTLGIIALRGAVATIDDVSDRFFVVSASTGGLTNLDAAITSRMATYTQPTGFLAASFPSDPADQSLVITATDALATLIGDLPTNAELATALGTADDAVLTAIDALPTNAELATALGTADDAVLAQIALVKAQTDNLPSDPADASVIAGLIAAVEAKIDTIDDFLDTEIAAIKTKTDQLVFTTANQVDVNVQSINDVALTGTGVETTDEWRPA